MAKVRRTNLKDCDNVSEKKKRFDTLPTHAGAHVIFFEYLDPHNDKALQYGGVDYWGQVDVLSWLLTLNTLFALARRTLMDKILHDLGF